MIHRLFQYARMGIGIMSNLRGYIGQSFLEYKEKLSIHAVVSRYFLYICSREAIYSKSVCMISKLLNETWHLRQFTVQYN